MSSTITNRNRPAIASPLARRWRQAVVAAAVVLGWGLALASVKGGGFYPDRFATVSRDELYRSAQPSAEQLRLVCSRYGVRTVVSLRDCRPETDPRIADARRFMAENGVAFVNIPSQTPPGDAQMREFVLKMDDPDVAKPVLVHCAAGRTRTGAAVAIWRVLRRGWAVDEALRDARRNGLHDDATAEMIREFVTGNSGMSGEGKLAPLIDRHR